MVSLPHLTGKRQVNNGKREKTRNWEYGPGCARAFRRRAALSPSGPEHLQRQTPWSLLPARRAISHPAASAWRRCRSIRTCVRAYARTFYGASPLIIRRWKLWKSPATPLSQTRFNVCWWFGNMKRFMWPWVEHIAHHWARTRFTVSWGTKTPNVQMWPSGLNVTSHLSLPASVDPNSHPFGTETGRRRHEHAPAHINTGPLKCSYTLRRDPLPGRLFVICTI